jgi:hypothetical protein
MMNYTNNRDAYRQTFFLAWQKHLKKLPLEPLETALVKIILLHPEYHSLIEQPATYQQQEFNTEENPFFHLSLHLALQEQINTNRPAGIQALYQHLISQTERYDHPHQIEHEMMHCLAQMMWKMQQTGLMISEEEYLAALKKL